MRIYATNHLRVLLRAQTPFFHTWGVELLITQLHDKARTISGLALDILDEACEDDANLHSLVHMRPPLLHMGDKGALLLTRYVISFNPYLLPLFSTLASSFDPSLLWSIPLPHCLISFPPSIYTLFHSDYFVFYLPYQNVQCNSFNALGGLIFSNCDFVMYLSGQKLLLLH